MILLAGNGCGFLSQSGIELRMMQVSFQITSYSQFYGVESVSLNDLNILADE
jgi:hypothetical protein